MMGEKYDLTQLLVTANFACEAAKVAKVDLAIHCGDLSCREASRVETSHREVYYQVYYQVMIKGVSPEAETFQKFVREYLEKQGFKDVVVLTSW